MIRRVLTQSLLVLWRLVWRLTVITAMLLTLLTLAWGWLW